MWNIVNYIKISVCAIVLFFGPEIYDFLITKIKKSSDINEILFSHENSMKCDNKENHTNKCGCYRSNLSCLTEKISASRKSLCLSIFGFSNLLLANAIVACKDRGVKVKVIIDAGLNSKSIEILKRQGIVVKSKTMGQALMHHKLCLIDTDISIPDSIHTQPSKIKYKVPPQGLLIVGSQNWTHQGMIVNYDNTIITSDKNAISTFQTEFDRMWEDFSPV